MKYKIIVISVVAFTILLSIPFENYDAKGTRYHQHLQASPKEACTTHTEDTFCTHLPLLQIKTEAQIPDAYVKDEFDHVLLDDLGYKVRNNETVSASISYFDSQTTNNHLTDTPTLVSKALTRTRGRSSRAFEKNSYYIKVKQDNLVDNKKVSFSGMTEDSTWALYGPYLDKTLLRNYLCYNLAGEMMDYAPNVRFCELYLNDDYMGLYLLTEKINYNDDGRINVTETRSDMPLTSYILRLDVGADDAFYALNPFTNYTERNGLQKRASSNLEIIYPSTTLTQVQKKEIEDSISRFEKALVSFDSADQKHGYPAYIDVDSFVSYFIFNEFTMNLDAGSLSTYLYKDLRGKINMAVWDCNSTFNNYEYDVSQPQNFVLTNKFWFYYLLKDEAFVNDVISTYHKLRKTYLSDEYLLSYIDDTIRYLGPAIERNNARWASAYLPEQDMLQPSERNPRTYEEAVSQLKDMIVKRGAFLDQNIENLKALCHDSTNKKFKHAAGTNE